MWIYVYMYRFIGRLLIDKIFYSGIFQLISIVHHSYRVERIPLCSGRRGGERCGGPF